MVGYYKPPWWTFTTKLIAMRIAPPKNAPLNEGLYKKNKEEQRV